MVLSFDLKQLQSEIERKVEGDMYSAVLRSHRARFMQFLQKFIQIICRP